MITAIISKKGGVGKTTTAVNLAAALAGIGKRVLLMDLDSQASASLLLGVPRSYLVPSLADVLLHSRPIQDTVRSTSTLGLDLVTASADLQSFDQDLAAMAGKESRLKAVLEPVLPRYDFVLLDCPPSLSLLSLNALVAADNFIVPCVPHFLAVAGLDSLLSTADRLYERFGVRPQLLGLLLTQVDYRTAVARKNSTEVRERFGDRVFAVEIRTNVRLAESPGVGKTVFELDPRCSGAKAHRLLAAEVLMRAKKGVSAATSKGPGGRMGSAEETGEIGIAAKGPGT